jgi:hypothetical protein
MGRKNNRKQQRSRRGQGVSMSNKLQLYKQLYEKDLQVIDTLIEPNDTTNIGYDLYSVINTATDYSNMQTSYGEMRWVAAEFEYMPFFRYSAVVTDYALGYFGVRQGVFDTTVTAKSALQTVQLPGSFQISNKDPWKYKTPIVHNKPISTSDTNTAQSEMPKVNFYFGYTQDTTTNSSAGNLHIKLVLYAFSKKE